MGRLAAIWLLARLFQLDGAEQNRNISSISESVIGQSGTIAQSTGYPQVNRKWILNQVDLAERREWSNARSCLHTRLRSCSHLRRGRGFRDDAGAKRADHCSSGRIPLA